MDRSSVGILVSGIKAAISLFTSVSFSHVKRNPNEATHVLAKTCGSNVILSIKRCFLSKKIGYLPCVRLYDKGYLSGFRQRFTYAER
jgi:hypothetical protein